MKKLRLISYNLHKGLDPIGRAIGMAPIKAALQKLSPDFLLVQELAERRRDQTVENQLEDLADARWQHQAYGRNAVYPKGHHGNAILSSLAISRFHNLDLTIHPLEKRGLLHAEIAGEPSLHLITTHLDLLELTRKLQVQKILEYLAKIPARDGIVFAGDLNDWAGRLGPVFTALGFREHSLPTFPSWLPILPLDRIFTRNVDVTEFRSFRDSPWRGLSDHLPLAIDFIWPHNNS